MEYQLQQTAAYPQKQLQSTFNHDLEPEFQYEKKQHSTNIKIHMPSSDRYAKGLQNQDVHFTESDLLNGYNRR